MKRQTSQQLNARRREVVSLAHNVRFEQLQKIDLIEAEACAMVPPARLSGTASSRSPRRILPRMTRARDGRCDAHQGPLCAYARITAESGGSHSGVRTCSDFPTKERAIMGFENPARMRTQAIAGQSEAATAGRWR